MKTVFINCSPKKSFSASAYFLAVQALFVRGEKARVALRNKNDQERVLAQLANAGAVVFCLPLYVDSAPSHVLAFLRELERFCRENSLRLNVYCVANNGFIEGKQNEPLMQLFENFCARSGLNWGGGIGVGGGVMLNVTRILFVVQLGILLLNMALSGLQSGDFLPAAALVSFARQALVLLFLNAGLFYYQAGLGQAINRGRRFGKKYTRILLPSLLFILFADIFFTIISVLRGGLFRGWLSQKQPQ